MSISSAFQAVVDAAHSAITALAALLEPFAGSLAVALAIVVFTLLVRLLISPLTYWQVRGERRRAALAPQVEKLRAKHGDDPMALAAATLELQRANGANPFAAFLPALAQAPFFMVMYRVALDAPAGAVLGVPLTAHLFDGLPVFAVLLTVATALAWWSSRRMARTATPAVAARPAPAVAARPAPAAQSSIAAASEATPVARSKAGRAAKTEPAPDALNPMRFLRFLPYFTVAAVAWFPLAGAIYLVTSTAWSALEQLVWRRQVTTGNRR